MSKIAELETALVAYDAACPKGVEPVRGLTGAKLLAVLDAARAVVLEANTPLVVETADNVVTDVRPLQLSVCDPPERHYFPEGPEWPCQCGLYPGDRV